LPTDLGIGTRLRRKHSDGDDIGGIKVAALLDPLRGDPRFEGLADKVVSGKL
jgi:hypothetical protein